MGLGGYKKKKGETDENGEKVRIIVNDWRLVSEWMRGLHKQEPEITSEGLRGGSIPIYNTAKAPTRLYAGRGVRTMEGTVNVNVYRQLFSKFDPTTSVERCHLGELCFLISRAIDFSTLRVSDKGKCRLAVCSTVTLARQDQ